MTRHEGLLTKGPYVGCPYRSAFGCWRGEVLFKSLSPSAVCGRQVLNSFIHPVIEFIHSFFQQILIGYLLCARQCAQSFADTPTSSTQPLN